LLVNCVAYEKGRKVGDVSVAEIPQFISRPDCFVWVALKDPRAEELQAMQAVFDLHPLAVEDANHGHQRPKMDEYGESLFVVLHMIDYVRGEIQTGELAVFVGRKYVVSVRSRSERGFVEVRKRTEREPELLKNGPGYVLYALMDAVVDRYFPVLDALETELEEIEQTLFSNQDLSNPRDSIEALYALKQKLMRLKHAVGPLQEAAGKLFGGRVPYLCSGLHEYFSDVHDHLARVNQSIESAREMLTTAISVNLSMLAIQDNEVTKRLASYAALVAVPTAIAGIYGMNFTHMPELDWRFGYPLALAIMGGIDGYLFYRFRKAKWL
jgi:magnesium transporter